jgi:hypothetical protein
MANEELTVVEWRACQKGESLRGFLSLELANGMILRGCTWHQRGDGASWLGLPTRPYSKPDGTSGWSKIVDFVDKESYRQFQKAAREAVEEFFAEEAETGARHEAGASPGHYRRHVLKQEG